MNNELAPHSANPAQRIIKNYVVILRKASAPSGSCNMEPPRVIKLGPYELQPSLRESRISWYRHSILFAADRVSIRQHNSCRWSYLSAFSNRGYARNIKNSLHVVAEGYVSQSNKVKRYTEFRDRVIRVPALCSRDSGFNSQFRVHLTLLKVI